MWQRVVERHVCVVYCSARNTHAASLTLHTTRNTHAALRHAATSPNIYNDVILPSVLTEI